MCWFTCFCITSSPHMCYSIVQRQSYIYIETVNTQEDKTTFLGAKDRIEVTYYRAKHNYKRSMIFKIPFHIKVICGGFSLVSSMKHLRSPTIRTQKITFLSGKCFVEANRQIKQIHQDLSNCW